MLQFLLILYNGDDTDPYSSGADSYGAVDSAAGYGGDSDAGDQYLRQFFDGADSYVDMLFGSSDSSDGYGQQEQVEPYSESDDVAGYDSGPTIINVFYQDMYEADYDAFGL